MPATSARLIWSPRPRAARRGPHEFPNHHPTKGEAMSEEVSRDHRSPVTRLSRDLVQAATTLTEDEARYLVDAYYLMQDDRKRAHNQVKAIEAEPHSLIAWLADQ